MSRPLRLEFEGAFWHVTSRGNERKDIFREDRDRLLFLSLLAAAVKRFRWRLHEYCLMTNHYHLVIETPFRTLAKGIGVSGVRPLPLADARRRSTCRRETLVIPPRDGNSSVDSVEF